MKTRKSSSRRFTQAIYHFNKLYKLLFTTFFKHWAAMSYHIPLRDWRCFLFFGKVLKVRGEIRVSYLHLPAICWNLLSCGFLIRNGFECTKVLLPNGSQNILGEGGRSNRIQTRCQLPPLRLQLYSGILDKYWRPLYFESLCTFSH